MKKIIIGFIIGIVFLAIFVRNCFGNSIEEETITSFSSRNNDKELYEEKEQVQKILFQSDKGNIEIPKCSQGVDEQILFRKAYTTSYNCNTKCPNWVAWHLIAEHADGKHRRLKNFHEEKDIPMPRATIEDYIGSGWSRGHMCPAGDNKWDAEAMYESFSLVNVCPQNANLNSGLWNSIEMDCRKWALKYGDIYIVCGPVYLKREHETIGYNKVYVPEAFFKVILCLNGTPKGFGFIVRNTDGNKKRDLYYNSIDQVERITGYDFFPILPDSIENEVEAKLDMTLWY
ncbi:MAG: DNA/RNA non-specific endonuclease [Prevotella sp.]|nr:DNA/RNA non-specific endonuclease [Prevotella sp.]